ncbi:MAG TPA: protein kinase [Polyangiaceae bacterium]|jgi:serine/threonine-protein kinase
MNDDSTPSLESSRHVLGGRYEVLALIGVGGMGAVYKVRDRELDEVVALKMLKREIADAPGVVERFRREVKLARRVTHPNVARTFDLGEHEGERFLTMELIEGESLAARLARVGRLSVSDTIACVDAICEGLDAAHAAGVVHRDLKPDNVLLAGSRVVITDFGVARGQEAGAAAKTAIPIGTPAYMAPEQVEASPTIDARADLYALGAMMFELLTGRLPFEADSVFAVAAMRLTQPPPDPRAFRPEIPETLALLVVRCMARKPDERPASAREVAARLASMTMPAESAVRPAAHATIQPPADAANKTVAVLPFRNGGSPEDDYLAEGVSDDILDALSMTPGLRVRPRGVVMQHKNAASDPRQLGRDLGVDVVVDGTVRAAGDAVRVNARVLSVEDGFQIWAKRFEGSRADVLRIGDDAARAIADALTVRKPERAALMTDPVAIDLYLRGRHEFLKFWGEANQRAVDLLAQAHARAPQDPLIMAGYALSLARQLGVANSMAHSDTARRVAEEAVRVAPKLAEAHLALANVRLHENDPQGTAAGIVRALQLAPLLPEAHDLRARLLLEIAPPREAIEAAERAIQLEPRLLHLRYSVQARARFVLGELDEREYAEAPSDPDVAAIYWVMMGRLVMWKGDYAEAARFAERIHQANMSSHPMVSTLSAILAKHDIPSEGRHFETRKTDARLTQRARVFWNQLSAEVRLFAGQMPLDDVKRAVELGLFDISWMDGCPLLEPLRREPELAALRATVAARAQSVLLQLHGGEATLAS